jgi:hypothetical protein
MWSRFMLDLVLVLGGLAMVALSIAYAALCADL